MTEGFKMMDDLPLKITGTSISDHMACEVCIKK